MGLGRPFSPTDCLSKGDYVRVDVSCTMNTVVRLIEKQESGTPFTGGAVWVCENLRSGMLLDVDTRYMLWPSLNEMEVIAWAAK